MKKIFIILIVFSVGMISRANAQVFTLNYRMSAPLKDSHDFISKMSFRGMSADYHHYLSEHFAIGLSLGWNTFYKHLNYQTNNFIMDGEKVTITGDQFRYLNIVPIMASVRYQFTKGDAAVLPYVGVGIGTNWAETRLEIGDLLAKEKGWQFAVAPEIGMIIPFSEHVGMNVAAQYHYGAKTGDLPALQNFGVKVGLALNLN